MSTRPERTRASLADATIEFVLAFDAWMQKTAMANAGESMARLRLLYELHCSGPRRMTDLADALGVTPRNVTALVDALEGDGMLRRVEHPTDRRVTMIEITGGAATVDQRFRALQAAVGDLFAGVGDGDRAAFSRVVDVVHRRVDDALERSTSD